MSKDRLKDSESKYWEGKSSLDDERYLKATKDDAYFKGLKAAKEKQLKWTFDDFMTQTEEGVRHKAPVRKRGVIQLRWKYVGVAAALLLVGLLFLKNQTMDPINENNETYAIQKSVQTESANLPMKEDSIFETEKEDTSAAVSQRVAVQPEKEEPERTVPRHPRVEIVEESYVMVNGKPVYDEDEVEKIVLASLQVMASNFQEGREAVEKIKHIKVEL